MSCSRCSRPKWYSAVSQTRSKTVLVTLTIFGRKQLAENSTECANNTNYLFIHIRLRTHATTHRLPAPSSIQTILLWNECFVPKTEMKYVRRVKCYVSCVERIIPYYHASCIWMPHSAIHRKFYCCCCWCVVLFIIIALAFAFHGSAWRETSEFDSLFFMLPHNTVDDDNNIHFIRIFTNPRHRVISSPSYGV